jgi:chromosome segregation ATPase
MAKGGTPSTDQLLDLLKRAAEELKHSQEESRTAITALQKEQAAHADTETELDALKQQLKGSKALQSTDEQLLRDQIDAERENSKALVERIKELETELKNANVERDALRQRVADGDTAISVEQQQEEGRRQALMTEHANALDALKAEHEISQKAMIEDTAGKLVQVETALTQEREKHQTTAQKLLEARSKVREFEASLAAEQERVKGLEAASKQMSDAHEQKLRETTAKLASDLQHAQAELAKATTTWQQVERQYEALHREMLLTLEQRDDARRQLENERAERERLSRALQGHRT